MGPVLFEVMHLGHLEVRTDTASEYSYATWHCQFRHIKIGMYSTRQKKVSKMVPFRFV